VLCDGLYGAGNDAKAVYLTHDRGVHWKLVNQADFKGTGRLIRGHGLTTAGYAAGITMRPDGHGWLWEHRGWAYSTTNAGRNWRQVALTSPDASEAQSISFPTNTTGFMLLRIRVRPGFDDRLVRSNNGGHTWTGVRTWHER
jgi:photosystem II stability/assembly factor-like uncharacterized protein